MIHVKFEAHSMKTKGFVVVLQDQGLLGHKTRTIKKPFSSEKMPGDPQLFWWKQIQDIFSTNLYL